MNKTQAWTALFSEQPKKSAKFEEALATIAGDKEPDADADAAFDDATRDRIQDFLMDADAFCKANASDPRVSFWRRMVPAPTMAPATKPKVAPKAKPVGALPAKPATTTPPAAVVLPPRKAGLNPNAFAAAARASTAPATVPTLSLGNVPASVVAPIVNRSAAPATPSTAIAPSTIVVAGAPSVPPQSADPIVLTEQAVTGLIAKEKKPSVSVRTQLREEAQQVARAKVQLEFEAAERQRRADREAAEQQRILDEEAAERKRVREEQAAERKRLSDEAAAERKRLKDEADRKRQQAENVPKEEKDRRAAFVAAHTPPAEHVALLCEPLYVLCRESYTELCVKARSEDSAERAQGQAQLLGSLTLLHNWRDGGYGRERAAIARHILRLIDELAKKNDLTDATWFKCNFVTGKWEETSL